MRPFLLHASALILTLVETQPVPPPHASGLSLPLDGRSAQATFNVPCARCLGGADDHALSFDFQAYPSQQPCGASNLTLNGLPLVQHWNGTNGKGKGTLVFDQRAFDIGWESNCLFDDAAASPHGSREGGKDTAHVLTVTIEKIDDHPPPSLSGFTVSFNQYPQPHLLKLSRVPITPAPIHPAEEWRVPVFHPFFPAQLDTGLRVPETSTSQKTFVRAIKKLEKLELHKKQLEDQIQQQKKLIQSHTGHKDCGLQEELNKCDNVRCRVRVVSQHVRNGIHQAFDRLYSAFHNDHHTSRPPFWPATGGTQNPTMIDTAKSYSSLTHNVQRPPQAHTLPNDRPDGYSTLVDDLEPGPPPPKFRRPQRRHPIIAAIHFILVILGLAALFSFVRRRCSSLRTRRDRAESREERRNRRAHRRAVRRARFKNWWKSGWGKRKDAERRMDYEEKRALVLATEGRLEEAMQGEIRALSRAHNVDTMQHEIQELRRAHNMVDELVRAEEGRISPARPALAGSRMPGMASIATLMMGAEHVPAHLRYAGSISSGDDTLVNTPPSSASPPRSRTNSLPSYQTDPDSDTESRYFSDNPPSYRTDEEDTDSDSDASSNGANGNSGRRPRPGAEIIVTNGFMQYAPSEYTPSILSPTDSASIFTPDSSIQDFSPRQSFSSGQSVETVRTFA